jgi:hypothetical protein
MVEKINTFLQTITMFNFGFGVGTNVCAVTIQIWPFNWSISVAKHESAFEARVGPVSLSTQYKKSS